jgi:hypothetical protein
LISGLKHSFQDIGVQNLDDLKKNTQSGKVRFEKRSAASQVEGDFKFHFQSNNLLLLSLFYSRGSSWSCFV